MLCDRPFKNEKGLDEHSCGGTFCEVCGYTEDVIQMRAHKQGHVVELVPLLSTRMSDRFAAQLTEKLAAWLAVLGEKVRHDIDGRIRVRICENDAFDLIKAINEPAKIIQVNQGIDFVADQLARFMIKDLHNKLINESAGQIASQIAEILKIVKSSN